MTDGPTNLDIDVAAAPKTPGIYKIENLLTRRCYIGQAVNVRARLSDHLRHLRAGNHASPILRRAFAKYPEAAWRFILLEACPHAALTDREAYHAGRTGSLGKGYNSAPIRSGVNVTPAFRNIARAAALKAHAAWTAEHRSHMAMKAWETRRKRQVAK